MMLVIGLFAVRRNAEHPVPSALVYVENADSAGRVVGFDRSLRSIRGHGRCLARSRRTGVDDSPLDESRGIRPAGRSRAFRSTRRTATLVRDTLLNGARRVVLRVTAPRGTTALFMRASGAKVSTSSIDGRVVDTTRYRRRTHDWRMEYWAVPDSGAIVALSIPAGAAIDFEMTARRPGLPAIPGVIIPPRPESVVPAQTGDASYVYKRLRF